MDFKIKKFTDFSMFEWNNLLNELEGPIYNCNWNNLNYYSAYDKVKNVSFAIFYEKKLIALIPVAKNSNNKKLTFSFGNNLIFSFLFKPNITQSLRKRIYHFVFDFLKQKAKQKKLKQNIQVGPIFFINNKSYAYSKNQFELLEYCKNYIVHNTLIVDLNKDENILISEMSKYHLRNIKRTSRIENLKFNILNNSSSSVIVKKKFSEFQKYHLISAGKLTRPKKTWKIMLQKIFDNEAELFFLSLENKSISYLYCSKWKDFAWGWSQVNLKKYEKISPRHYLEWNAIKYYKSINCRFYEIGERYNLQKNFKPTSKELSISNFKEKYGSDKYPKTIFHVEV